MLLSSCVALASTTLLMPLALRILRRMHVVDLATSRSSHEGMALRGTGIALVAGVLTALPVALLEEQNYWYLVLAVLLFGSIAGCLGFLEDVRGLSVRGRLSIQFFLSLFFGVAITISLDAIWVVVPLIAFLGVAYINMSNFMDGLNGMSGFHGVIGGLSFVAMGLLTGHLWLSSAGAILAAVFIAFIPWNLGRQGTFLGDSGSYLLGSLHIGLVCAAVVAGIPVIAALGSTAIYVADTVSTLAVRAMAGEKLAEPHRHHVYQRLNDLGWTHLQVSGTTAVFSAVVSTVGLIALSGRPGSTVLAIVLISMIAILYLLLPMFVQMMRHRAKMIEDGGSATNG